MVKDIASPGGADGIGDGRFTNEDLVSGKRVTRFISVVCAVALFACIGIAIFVVINVPWDTRMPYDGKYNRGGSGIPMQIALLPALVPIMGFWKVAKGPKAHHMNSGGRARAYLFVTSFVLACLFLQAYFARGILAAGGYFGG